MKTDKDCILCILSILCIGSVLMSVQVEPAIWRITLKTLFPLWVHFFHQPFVKCQPGKESIFCELLPNALSSAWSSFSVLLRSQTEYPIVFQQQTGTSQLSKMAEKEVIAFHESNVLLNV